MNIDQLSDYYKKHINRELFPKFGDWILDCISCETIDGRVVDAKLVPIGGLFIAPWNYGDDVYMKIGDDSFFRSINVKSGTFGYFEGSVCWLSKAKLSVVIN
jgi:hypothetical protein